MSDELSKQLNSPADVLDAFCNLLSGLKVATPSLNLTPLQCWHIGRKVATRISELEAQLADAQKDAARYQWLREQEDGEKVFCVRGSSGTWGECGHSCVNETHLDDVIDAAIAEEKQA